jgi:hypothetical protein
MQATTLGMNLAPGMRSLMSKESARPGLLAGALSVTGHQRTLELKIIRGTGLEPPAIAIL